MVSVTIKAGFPPEYAMKLWRWLNTPRAPNFDDFGAKDVGEFARQFAFRTRTQKLWSIIADGTLVGYAAFAPQNPICGQFQGVVIAPTWRGKGIGTEAMQQITAELHAAGFTKLLAMTFADNIQVLSMLLRTGFQPEGFLVAATQRDGEPLDIQVMSKTYPHENVRRDTIHTGGD